MKENKLFDKQSLVLLFSVVAICILCITSVSYAYFTTLIKGYDKATPISLQVGTMTVKFEDGNAVTFNNALPGDSITHTFMVTNTTGTLEASYNIKLDIEQNDFDDKKDLVYTLKKNGSSETQEHILPYTDSYILTNVKIAFGAEDKYELTVKFKEDQKNKDQNDNKQKHLNFKIVVDSQMNVEESYLENNTFFMKLEDSLNVNQAAFDDFNNLRYIGSTPNNYIWFNCDDYDKVTNEATATAQRCEKWRIIGLFNNVEKVNVDGSIAKENLVKIIRDESIGNIAWDSNKSNNWTNATLNETLNNETTGYISSSYNVNNVKGITANTKGMIEKVEWNLGGRSDIQVNAEQFYKDERGNITYNSQPSTWKGYIGLMYPSDYGYATNGSNNENTNRETCLSTQLHSYGRESYCYEKDWLFNGEVQWTFMPFSNQWYGVFDVTSTGTIDGDNASPTYVVRPSLYLTSKVRIKDGGGTGDATHPYILEVMK